MLPYSYICLEILFVRLDKEFSFFFVLSTQSTSYAYVIELDLGTPPQRVTYYSFTKRLINLKCYQALSLHC